MVKGYITKIGYRSVVWVAFGWIFEKVVWFLCGGSFLGVLPSVQVPDF